MANEEVKNVPATQNTFCRTCYVPVNAGNKESHESGKKHQFLEKTRTSNLTRLSRWIHVTELPLEVNHFDVTEYFRQFGTVTSTYFPRNKPYCFVEFSKSASKLNIFNHKHWLGDKEVAIMKIPATVKKSLTPKNVFDGPNVLENINQKTTIENQIKSFLESSAITDEEVLVRERFAALLTSTLQEVFPGSRLEIVGSTANGMAFLGCDLDVSLFMPFERGENEVVKLEKHNVPQPQDVLLGRFKCENLSYLNQENIVTFLSKYLMYLSGFKRCYATWERGFPVIQFTHGPTNLRCFLSLNKSLGLANTQLLQLYGELDYYVYALLMVLRFWGKREKLVGGVRMISTYAFSWLVLFYLQRKNLVPTVEKLAQLSDLSVESEGWDCSFTEDIERIPVGTKDKSFAELMSGFFEFYSMFDFTSNIICPRDGTIILKSELLAEAGAKLDFQLTELSVQDVFDLTSNITAGVSVETINKFHSMCAKQLIVWQDMIKHRKVCLKFLFDNTLAQETLSGKALQLNISLQSHDLGVAHYEIHEVCNFVLDIFKRVFLFQCDIINTSSEFEIDNESCTIKKVEENPSKKQKKGELLEKFLMEVKCQIFHRSWISRKNFKINPTVPTGLQRLDYEESISREIAKSDSSKVDNPQLFGLNAGFSLWKESNELRILFIPKTVKNELVHTVVPFVKKYVTTLAESSLKAYLTSKSS